MYNRKSSVPSFFANEAINERITNYNSFSGGNLNSNSLINYRCVGNEHNKMLDFAFIKLHDFKSQGRSFTLLKNPDNLKSFLTDTCISFLAQSNYSIPKNELDTFIQMALLSVNNKGYRHNQMKLDNHSVFLEILNAMDMDFSNGLTHLKKLDTKVLSIRSPFEKELLTIASSIAINSFKYWNENGSKWLHLISDGTFTPVHNQPSTYYNWGEIGKLDVEWGLAGGLVGAFTPAGPLLGAVTVGGSASFVSMIDQAWNHFF